MNLWLSPHGIWYFRKVTTLPCGRRKEIKKSLKTRDKQDAKAKVVRLLSCVRSTPLMEPPKVEGKVRVEKPVTSPLTSLASQYLKEKRLSWSAKEQRDQHRYIEAFISLRGDRPVAKYVKADAVRFKESLLESGKSPTTINKYLQKLSLLFDWLKNHLEGVINPFTGLTLRRLKETQSRSGYSRHELGLFMRWANRQLAYRKWIALLGAYTGARANEICQLYADDVQQIDGVWCLNVRANRSDQKLKTLQYAAAILGHSNGAISYDRYGGEVSVAKLQEALELSLSAELTE